MRSFTGVVSYTNQYGDTVESIEYVTAVDYGRARARLDEENKTQLRKNARITSLKDVTAIS